jgi:ribosomal protein L40E
MAHFAVHIFVVVVVLVVGWALFFAWLIGTIFHQLWLGFSRLTGIGPRRRLAQTAARNCPRVRCGAINPPEANFCRRCGSPMIRPSAHEAPHAHAGLGASSIT